MVAVPAGTFAMGSPADEPGRFDDEGPVHDVTIPRPFAVTRTPITVGQFARFARATGFTPGGGCNVWNENGEWSLRTDRNWNDPGFVQGDDYPVVCVSWEEAKAYARWISERSGYRYRLLAEPEFEYSARAGVAEPFPWGTVADRFCEFANGFDQSALRGRTGWGTAACDDGYAYTAPVERFPANRFGLVGMTGNAFQWVEDCFVDGGYGNLPAKTAVRPDQGCKARVIRGGSWANSPRGLRLAMRDRDPQSSRYANISIRLARDLQ